MSALHPDFGSDQVSADHKDETEECSQPEATPQPEVAPPLPPSLVTSSWSGISGHQSDNQVGG